MKTMTRVALLAVLASTLSGCFLTKIVTTPMRVGGAAVSTVGAVLSIVPVAGNTADAALEKADAAIDTVADSIDKIPI